MGLYFESDKRSAVCVCESEKWGENQRYLNAAVIIGAFIKTCPA